MKSETVNTQKPNTPNSSIFQTLFRCLLGSILITTGIGHLTWLRAEFPAQVPKWVPLNEDLVVILSGITEIGLGCALIFLKKYRVQIGWIAAAFFVVVFPGNISQYTNHISAFGLDSDTKRFIRLLFQPVLVLWALWSTSAWREWRRRRATL